MVLMPNVTCKDIEMKNVGMAVVTVRASPVILAVLPTFDLARPVARVAKEHPDWSADRLVRAESDYRTYLLKCKVNPGKNVPTMDVDEMFHAHILHTKQYHDDCQAYFGYYLHHEPFDKDVAWGVCSDNQDDHLIIEPGQQPADSCGDSSACTSCGSGGTDISVALSA